MFLVTTVAWPALAWAGAVFAQPKKPPFLIGWLHVSSRETSGHFLTAFKEGLAALGWKEGSQVVVEERWANGRWDGLPSLADELAVKKPVIIVAASTRAVLAATRAAPKTPIVMATGSDLVAQGLVKSLARPGGTITGVTNFRADLAEKYLELLLGAAPKLKRVGFLIDPNAGVYSQVMDAARRSAVRYSVEARFADAGIPEEIEPAITRLGKEDAAALLVMSAGMFRDERRRIVKLALAHRWPVIVTEREFAEEGALLSYGVDILASYRRAAYYADRILKGAKPSDLPIEQPTKFELVINMKTARALKLEILRELAVRADRVIE